MCSSDTCACGIIAVVVVVVDIPNLGILLDIIHVFLHKDTVDVRMIIAQVV